jgi:hypothetical protein
MDNLGFFFIAAILLIQIYKIARPILPKLGVSEGFLNTMDKAMGFVYDVVPGIYRVVEAMASKGKIKPEAKWVEFLKLLDEQARQEGVTLSSAERARAELLVKDLAAQDHQPKTTASVNPTLAPALAAVSQ